jgi:Tfp pilus assembly protein FimT
VELPVPCPTSILRSKPHAAAGIARLEFALTVVVLSIVAAFALDRIAQVQVSAHGAQLETKAALTRSTAALEEARCAVPPALAAASEANTFTPAHAPRTGTASRVDFPVPSCP